MPPFRIITTGPESSGKSTLAADLAAALQAPMVPEFARPYLVGLTRPYVHSDLAAIHLGQRLWERWQEARTSGPWLVCDTDWTVMRVWESYRFGSVTISASDQASANAFYLLCSPDIPWEADPLREHPEERQILFQWYQRLLVESGARFSIINGGRRERLEKAMEIIGQLSEGL